MGYPAGHEPSVNDGVEGLLVQIADALGVGGTGGSGSGSSALTTTPRQYATVSNFTVGTTDGTVLTLAAGEKGFIQNLDDAAVYVKLGATASSSSFSYVLKAGTAANDGLGGLAVIDDYIGVVSIAAASGSPRVIAWKLS